MADCSTSVHKKVLNPGHPDYFPLLIFVAMVVIALVFVCWSFGTASAAPILKDMNLKVETVTTGLSSWEEEMIPPSFRYFYLKDPD